jgi:hypothetical protein
MDFWDVTPCDFYKCVYVSEKSAGCLFSADVGSKVFRNTCKYLKNYTVLQWWKL